MELSKVTQIQKDKCYTSSPVYGSQQQITGFVCLTWIIQETRKKPLVRRKKKDLKGKRSWWNPDDMKEKRGVVGRKG